MRCARSALASLLLVFATAAAADEGRWALPAEGSCVPASEPGEEAPARDAIPRPKPGDVVDFEDIASLRAWLPPEIWAVREMLFYEGMQLEIGPCYRDYSPPAFYAETTQRFRGESSLDAATHLAGHTAGLPFAPETIDPDAADAGVRWAWNFVHRYQGGGAYFGAFRAAHLADRREEAMYFEGDMFQALVSARADRPGDGYRMPKQESFWVARGRFERPGFARGVTWLHFRSRGIFGDPLLPDDVFRYLPAERRVKRVANVPYETHIPIVGEAIRPNRFRWKVLGTRDVLAPINARGGGYPSDPDRTFGPWGLSFASDRWELRRALVLEGTLYEPERAPNPRTVLTLDLQTLSLLYQVWFDAKGEAAFPTYHVGRWSEDRPDYPRWPDDPERPVRAIDVVGRVTYTTDGGCRIEAWDAVAVPPSDRKLSRLLKPELLGRQGR